jgi:hypothetical protein
MVFAVQLAFAVGERELPGAGGEQLGDEGRELGNFG